LDAARLRVITGPTASGKSALALRLAEREPLAIISADSRQIYRRFDIGTAKPSVEDRARVPHLGLDVVEPEGRYSAAAWADDALRWIGDAHAAGRTPVIVGGTGFYLRALAAPLFDEPELDPDRRGLLLERLDAMDTETLRRWSRALDPARAALGRTQLLRALEIALLTGVPISRWHRETERPARVRVRYLVVDPGPELAGAIEQRTDAMLRDGWVEEVESLRRTVDPEAPAWKATGYAAIRARVEGRLTSDETRQRIVIDTRQYAKRQRTWFRHQLTGSEVTRVDPRNPDVMERVWSWWNQPDDA
jgi:tRNA dimethylallyltransferase